MVHDWPAHPPGGWPGCPIPRKTWSIVSPISTNGLWTPGQPSRFFEQVSWVSKIGHGSCTGVRLPVRIDLEILDGFYLAFCYKAADATNWLPESERAYHYKLIFHGQGNAPERWRQRDQNLAAGKPTG